MKKLALTPFRKAQNKRGIQMANISTKIKVALLLCSIIIFPGMSVAASSEPSTTTSTAKKSGSSDYGKSSYGRFKEANNMINQQRFSEAYVLLAALSVKSKDEADRQNLLGFTARKHGKLDIAANHYERALAINPKHKGALEYQGELFLMLGQTEKARQNLKLLKAQCWLGCLEVTKLEAAIADQ